MENDKVLEKLRLFTERYQDGHSKNVQDFKISKNMSSGNGFTIAVEQGMWGKDRARVAVNMLEPAVNSIVYKFTETPFDFQTDADIDLAELKFQLGAALREAVIDGLAYMLVYKENEKIKFSRLNNFNVIFGDCDFADGSDASEVVYIDKEQVSPDEYSRSSLANSFQHILNLKKYEVPIITYWVRDDKGVTTYKIVNEEVVSSVTQPIENIPIARIYGKEYHINYERNWRGLYYAVVGILRTMDFQMSLIQERVATTPNHKYWVAEESVGTSIEKYSRPNDIPTTYKTYKATNPNLPGVTLPAPARNDESIYISELLDAFGVHRDIIAYMLGTISGEEKGSETAEAVLLRRENKDTAANDLLKNLLDSSHFIAKIIEQFTGMECRVASDIFEKAKKANELDKMLAFCNYIASNQQAFAIAPLLVQRLDVDAETQQAMMEMLAQSAGASDEKQRAIELLENENKQLRANAEAQMVSANMEHNSRIAVKQMEMLVKQEEIRLEYARLGAKAEADGMDMALKSEKIKDDFEKESAKLMLAAEKARMADENAKAKMEIELMDKFKTEAI